MQKETNSAPGGRRRFLRESLKGSVPLVASWVGSGARALWKLAAEPRPASPPPVATEAPPAGARRELDARQDEFARDNPGSQRYPG